MKRNWDTIREILSKVEEMDGDSRPLRLASFPAERAKEISYHVELLLEAGLVHGKMSREFGPPVPGFQLLRLTWEGHEFLDAIRSDNIWNKTKKFFLSQGISMTFDLVKSVAIDIASSCIKSVANP